MTRHQILIVDDDPGIRDILDLILTEEGYQTVTVSDPRAALRQIETSPPRLILLDCALPISGAPEFVAEYRARSGPHAPIIVLSAAPDVSQRMKAVDAAGHLPKPFEVADLLALIGAHVEPVYPAQSVSA